MIKQNRSLHLQFVFKEKATPSVFFRKRSEIEGFSFKVSPKDGWTITHDPLDLTVGGVELYADLGAEKLIAAERGLEKIAVEIKTFGGQSLVTEFHKATGQYDNYCISLDELEPERIVYSRLG